VGMGSPPAYVHRSPLTGAAYVAGAPGTLSSSPRSGFLPLPPPIQAPREATVMVHGARKRVPIWMVAAGATFLGVLAFVLVLFALSRLSSPRRHSAPGPTVHQADPFGGQSRIAVAGEDRP
jgi:hypothetical protein